MDWQNLGSLSPKQYTCGHAGCGKLVGPNVGYYATNVPVNPETGEAETPTIYICSFCQQPTYFLGERQIPGPPFGNEVAGLPDDIAGLYEEARSSYAVCAYTASVLTCRKILMNLAVANKAKEGQSFVEYVDHLADAGYVPPGGKGWVDHIRQRGNEANHEIRLMTRGDAEELIAFAEMLLKFIYEFPARVPARTTSAATQTP